MFPVLSQLLTPAQALQKHCSAAASNELWPLPNVRCRQMQVSERTALKEAWEGARGCCEVRGWAREGERTEPSESRLELPSEVPL